MEIDTNENLENQSVLNNTDISELIPVLKEKLNLFSKALESDKNTDENFTRINNTESFKNLSADFINEYGTKTEFIQYSRTYFNRLAEIKLDLMRQAADKWRNHKICENILDVRGKVNLYHNII
jgi:hypothetical protein